MKELVESLDKIVNENDNFDKAKEDLWTLLQQAKGTAQRALDSWKWEKDANQQDVKAIYRFLDEVDLWSDALGVRDKIVRKQLGLK